MCFLDDTRPDLSNVGNPVICDFVYYGLLPTGSEEREVLGIWTIPVAILPSCKDTNKHCIIMQIK